MIRLEPPQNKETINYAYKLPYTDSINELELWINEIIQTKELSKNRIQLIDISENITEIQNINKIENIEGQNLKEIKIIGYYNNKKMIISFDCDLWVLPMTIQTSVENKTDLEKFETFLKNLYNDLKENALLRNNKETYNKSLAYFYKPKKLTTLENVQKFIKKLNSNKEINIQNIVIINRFEKDENKKFIEIDLKKFY